MNQIALAYHKNTMTTNSGKKRPKILRSKEDKILESIQAGHYEMAFTKMYDYFPKIKKMLLSYGASEDDAKDIFQEAIIIMSNKLEYPAFVLDAKISTYLYSVSRYLCKDVMAKKNKVIPIDKFHSLTEDLVEDYEEKESKFEQIDTVLQQLGEKCKNILIAYYYKKKSMKEIAEAFNYSTVNSAKNQKYKCLERAKKMVIEPQLKSQEI
ncbi:MAG: sigma-70 family RNA polymerase sigma factor [Flavobacteriales bacterium]|nr:sigma-70 family RNA polymerase sigma factor [Flavobacteriales bacterium]